MAVLQSCMTTLNAAKRAPKKAGIAAAVSLALALALTGTMNAAHADPALTRLWQRYPGTQTGDYGQALAIDSAGGIIIGGVTYGSIGRQNEGDGDAFLIKFDPNGAIQWRRQPASKGFDTLTGLATDAQNNVIGVGYTYGKLAGPRRGHGDGFIVKYTADGTRLWQQQIGTAKVELIEAVATDTAGNIVVAGQAGTYDVRDSFDGLLIKYAPDGTEQWRRLLASTKEDYLQRVAIDDHGNIVVAGYTYGSLGGNNQGGSDSIVASYSSGGTLKWIKQSGTADSDWVNAVAVAASQIFVVGTLSCCTSSTKAFLGAFSTDGTPQWQHELPTTAVDSVSAIAVDAAGNVVISGTASRKTFISSYTPGGVLLWTQQLIQPVFPSVAAVDSENHLVLTGTINRGDDRSQDAYLAKYAPATP